MSIELLVENFCYLCDMLNITEQQLKQVIKDLLDSQQSITSDKITEVLISQKMTISVTYEISGELIERGNFDDLLDQIP